MKTLKRILIGIYLCVIGLFFGLGCDTRDCCDSPPKVLYKYYIDEYYYIESIRVGSPMKNDAYPTFNGNNFLIYNESENKTKYKQTSNYYGDTYYNRELESKEINRVYCNEFVRFDVISDTDFDEAHPAGTSLSDIVRLRAVSPYKYIKSGYTNEYNWKSTDLPQDFIYDEPVNFTNIYEPGYHPVNKLLSELTAEDMRLLYSVCFRFAKMPDVKGTHIITVIVEDKEKEMTGEIEWIFE